MNACINAAGASASSRTRVRRSAKVGCGRRCYPCATPGGKKKGLHCCRPLICLVAGARFVLQRRCVSGFELHNNGFASTCKQVTPTERIKGSCCNNAFFPPNQCLRASADDIFSHSTGTDSLANSLSSSRAGTFKGDPGRATSREPRRKADRPQSSDDLD